MNDQREIMSNKYGMPATLNESLTIIQRQCKEISRLQSELNSVISDRDALLSEVTKLKFELQVSNLKRFHSERHFSVRNESTPNGLTRECYDEEEEEGNIDDDINDTYEGNSQLESCNISQYRIWNITETSSRHFQQSNNLVDGDQSLDNSTYELSQDLYDKKIELLERKYGGVQARMAAIVIQRAFRRYMLIKKFTLITAMAKAEKRLNRAGYSSSTHGQYSESCEADRRNLCCMGSPLRTLSVREKRICDLESGTNSLPRSYANRCKTGSVCDGIICSTPGCSNTLVTIEQYQSQVYTKSQETRSEYSEYQSGRITQTSSSDSRCNKSGYLSNYQNPHCQHAPHSGRKVPPEVPKRTSSISMRAAAENQNFLLADSSFSKIQCSGSMSSVQSSSSDSSTAMNSSAHNESSYANTVAAWNKKSSPPSMIAETIRKRQYRVGLNLFNKKPEKGIAYLVNKGFLENAPQAIAKFLIARKGLSKQMIGEYLGNVQDPFNGAVLQCFTRELDLSGMQVDVALRKYQTHFRMPGEAQKIERLMEVFSQRYCQCNRDVVSRLRSMDTIFVLAFAIIMLNTDLHTPNLKPERRMKLEDFTKNLRGVDECHDIDRDMLVGIYERIKSNEFKPASDHVSQVMKVQNTIVGKKTNLALPHRRLVCYCRLYEVLDVNKKERPGVHQREVFLFNDLLVITKILNKKKNSVTYTFRQCFSLSGLEVSMLTSPYYPYAIKLSQRVDNHEVIIFNARNDHDRSKFVEDIRESILEMDEMESIRIEAEMEKQKCARSNKCVGNNNTIENRDSGVADIEVCSCLQTHNPSAATQSHSRV